MSDVAEDINRLEDEIILLSSAVEKIQHTLEKIEAQSIPEYCTLEVACRLKGGSEYRNLYTRPWQQPCCGTRFEKINGRKVWSKEQVMRWLKVTDSELENYAASLGLDISRNFLHGKNLK